VRYRSRIVFHTNDIRLAESVLAPFGFEPNRKPGVDIHSATLFVDDSRYNDLRSLLTSKGIEYAEDQEMFFENNELEEAEFFRMAPAGYWGYPQPEEDFDLYRKESYDVSTKCGICRNGSIQNRPLLVKGKPRFGRNDILAIHWEYEFIITDHLKSLIEKANLTGTDFWPILDHKKRTPVQGYCQLHIANILPPMSTSTQFELVTLERLPKSPCSCGKTGRNLAIHQMVYRRKDLLDARDFNKTNEWLGGGYGTTQWKVVSAKIYQLFKKHNIRSVTFQPVVIEG